MKLRFATALAFSLAIVAVSCAEPASDAELTRMCAHLAELRGEKPDEAKAKRCVDEARAEGVSRRQARCRIRAVNKQEYWTRCRTGAPRE